MTITVAFTATNFSDDDNFHMLQDYAKGQHHNFRMASEIFAKLLKKISQNLAKFRFRIERQVSRCRNFTKLNQIYPELTIHTTSIISWIYTFGKSSKLVLAFNFKFCMSMSMLYAHVNAVCPRQCCMSMLIPHVHANAACPCQYCMFMYMLHVHVYAVCPFSAACPGPCCKVCSCLPCMSMPMLLVNVSVVQYIHGHVAFLCLCCMSICPSPCFMSMSMFMLHVHVLATCPCLHGACSCCLSMLLHCPF
jgi:hypothetical protein